MNTYRTTARSVGALFLAAMAASLVGGGLVESAISAPLLSLYVELEMSIAMIFVLPMILNEIFMGIWLIARGFNAPAL